MIVNPRLIFHVDMDAFFASVEQRDRPELRGKPVIIGGGMKRGVVAAASYEVREFGVHSAMPMTRAVRLCPHAIIIPPNIEKYRAVSEEIMSVFADYSPLVEPLSFDEAFLDMTGSQAHFGEPVEIARAIKRDVRDTTQGLTCSVGIGANKFLAKLASPMQKPDGISFIRPGTEPELLAGMPVRKIWGVGEKTAKKLHAAKFFTFADLANADPRRLGAVVGRNRALKLQRLAVGLDDRPVEPDRERKSIGSEVTLVDDISGRRAVEHHLRVQCEEVARALRKREVRASSVRVKVRYSQGFQLSTRQGPLPTPSDQAAVLFKSARHLLSSLDLKKPIRLVGAAGFDLLGADDAQQLGLFSAAPGQSQPADTARLEATMDAIRDKFGDKIRRASTDDKPAHSVRFSDFHDN